MRGHRSGKKREPVLWAPDRDWTAEQWQGLLEELVARGIITWKDVTALVLGQLNPPQVGTSLATNKAVQAIYGQGKTWPAIREWLYSQAGKCSDCGTRLDLQVHHLVPRSPRKGLKGIHRLENYQLLCRRCNVIRRPSHKKGGITFLTAEAALMWLLLVHRPTTYKQYERLCREYGLTMANIRFQEAWAMAEWLTADGTYR